MLVLMMHNIAPIPIAEMSVTAIVSATVVIRIVQQTVYQFL